MSRSITHNPSPNWGGARKGAGRKKKLDAYSKVIGLRVSDEMFEVYKAEGGPKCIRAFLEKKVQAAANRKTLPAGFNPVNPESFAVPVEEPERTITTPEYMTAQCGFPSPALDYEGEEISIYDMVVKHRDATILVRAMGDSMVDAGIYEDDILVVDRAVEPRPGDIVLALINGEFTIKTFRLDHGRPELHPENEAANYPVIKPTRDDDFNIEGVIVSSIRKYRK